MPYLLQDVYKRQALRATVRAQKAAAEQAAETYRKTLITAVPEVEDALIAYGNYTSQMQYLHKENNANREAFLPVSYTHLDVYKRQDHDLLRKSF